MLFRHLRLLAAEHFFGLSFDAKFDAAQYVRDHFTDIAEHLLEHCEGFALVFVERIALRVGTQIDALP